jgi:hypothetical protein
VALHGGLDKEQPLEDLALPLENLAVHVAHHDEPEDLLLALDEAHGKEIRLLVRYTVYTYPACVLERVVSQLLDSTVLVVLILMILAWLLVALVVVAACRMAARSDAELPPSRQSPRRPTTWGTVRSKIFTSPHSDQFATYR